MTKASDGDALFAEKSLKELLKVYENAFPVPLAAKAWGAWLGILAFAYLLIRWHLKGLEVGTLQTAAGLMASYSLTVSSALMGVVIAGMSIFAASLKPRVADGLIKTPYPGTDTSSLKFIFSMFAYVLFALFLVISASAVYYIGLGDNALILSFMPSFSSRDPDQFLLKFLLTLYSSILLGLIFFLGSLLKSFIWNLHQVLLVVAVYNSLPDDRT